MLDELAERFGRDVNAAEELEAGRLPPIAAAFQDGDVGIPKLAKLALGFLGQALATAVEDDYAYGLARHQVADHELEAR